MSPRRTDAGAALLGSDELLAGWGGTAPTRARVVTPLNDADLGTLVDAAPRRGVIARGLGRAYGDAAQNSGGAVLDTTALTGVKQADLEQGVITVGAGTSLDALMRWLIPRGWFVPVTPGTKFVTVGGAIASDIHGKNHHTMGTFGNHVHALTLRTGGGEILELTPHGSPEAFWATTGGMGLTGVILDATFDLIPIETAYISVEDERCQDLDDLMARMSEGDDRFRYSDHFSNIDFDDDGTPGGTLSGFLVPDPVDGETNAATITVFVGEGDNYYPGDQFIFNSAALSDGFSSTNVWNGRSIELVQDGVDIDTFSIPWNSGLLQPGDTAAHIDLPTQIDIWNLVYIIVSFRSQITSGGTIDYLIRHS